MRSSITKIKEIKKKLIKILKYFQNKLQKRSDNSSANIDKLSNEFKNLSK